MIHSQTRENPKLEPGQKVRAIEYGDRIELIPVRPIRETRGFLQGIDTNVAGETYRG